MFKSTITFHSEYARLEFAYYYQERIGLFSSIDTEPDGNVLTIFHDKPFSDDTMDEMYRDFSVESAIFEREEN